MSKDLEKITEKEHRKYRNLSKPSSNWKNTLYAAGVALLGALPLACGGGGNGNGTGPEPPEVIGASGNLDAIATQQADQDVDYSGTAVAELSDGSTQAPDSSIVFYDGNREKKFGNTRSISGTIPATENTEGNHELLLRVYAEEHQGMDTENYETIIPGNQLTVNVKGASPDPGVGLVNLVNAIVGVVPSGTTDTTKAQTNSNGQAVIKGLDDGEYTLIARDEENAAIGEWYDIANPDNPVRVDVNGDLEKTVALFPNVPLAEGDTFYENNLDWYQQVQGENNLRNTADFMPDNGASPYKVFVDPDSALTGQVEAAKEGGSSWNGPDGNYDNVTFVDNEADADYTLVFTEGGSHTSRGQGKVSITRTTNTEATKEITAHEFSHVLFNINEETSQQGIYASDPSANVLPKPLEYQNFEAAKVLVINFSQDYPLPQYSPE